MLTSCCMNAPARDAPDSGAPARAPSRSHALDAIRRIELVQDGKAALSIAPGANLVFPAQATHRFGVPPVHLNLRSRSQGED